MSSPRRDFLRLAGLSTLALACAPPVAARAKPRPIRAVAFDLFTIFDPRGVDRRVEAVLPGATAAFATTWKSRLFEYSWLRAAAGRYVDFAQLARDSLAFAARTHRVELDARARDELTAALVELDAWPDARASLELLRARGLRLAPLANFGPAMIDALLARAGLRALFDAQISTDAARTYKPDPRAYALAERALDLPRAQIAFAAFGGWDAAGGRWFGFPTFWVNRFAVEEEELVPADATGPDLTHLVTWLA